jgi:ketosteroid isomerase-like protein
MKKIPEQANIPGLENPWPDNISIIRIMMMIFVLLSSVTAWSAKDKRSDSKDTAVEEKIWAAEEAYFVNLYKANYAAVVALYDDHFLGWPNGLKQPIGVEESSRFMKQLIPKPTSCTIRIERAGISILGTTALTQYTLRVDCRDVSGATKTQTSRITHTWIKKGTRWKLFGGMSIDQ